MALSNLFVGRTAEREAFEEVLASPAGQVVVVEGRWCGTRSKNFSKSRSTTQL